MAYKLLITVPFSPYTYPMTTTSYRIQLINNFKPFVFSKKKPLNQKLSNCTISLIISSISLVALIGYGYLTIILELIGIQDFFGWNKSGLIMIVLILNSISFQNSVFQYLLLKHIRFLNQSSDQFIDREVNENLQKIINELNTPFTSKNVVIGFCVLLISLLLNCITSSTFEYGNYFKIPFVLYSIYFVKLFWNNYKNLLENLIHVEIN